MGSVQRALCCAFCLIAPLVTAPARGDDEPYVSAGAEVYTQRGGANVDEEGVTSAASQRRIEFNPRQEPQPANFGEFRGAANAWDRYRIYGAVGGNVVDFTEGDRRSLEVDGGTYAILPFRVDSPTLAPGTNVRVDLALSMAGAAHVSGGGDDLLVADATLYVQIFGHGDDNDYYGNFYANVETGADAAHTLLLIDSEDAPEAKSRALRDAVRTTVTPAGNDAAVDWTETFGLNLLAGEEYLIEISFVTFTFAGSPADALAVTDFFSADAYGATATLTSADPAASITIVPEPASAAALPLASSLSLLRRRRRQSRALAGR